MTSKPWSLYLSSSCWRPSYCGVSPQNDATFTISVTLPFSPASTSGEPSSAAIFVSYRDIATPSASSGGRLALGHQTEPVEIERGDRAPFGAAQPDVLGLPAGAHRRGARRATPAVDREQAVLLPREISVERDAVFGQDLAVARDQRALVRAPEVGRRRRGEHVRDVADAGRAAHDRPVEEAGARRILAVDEEVAEVRVAVDERALAFAVRA